jgi:SSS family solute:Na+ symporter
MAWSDRQRPIHRIAFGGTDHFVYVGLLALVINVAIAVVATIVTRARHSMTQPGR